MKRRIALAAALTVAANMASAQSRPSSANGTLALDPDISAAATNAYVYGYPLVSMYVSKRVMTNVSHTEKGRAPINQVAALYAYPTAAFKDVVAPNVNTLYNSIWLDLSKEPIVIHQPDTHGRYYVMEVLDMWTNVIAAPGSRTTGTKAQEIAIVGPNWQGTMPGGITTVIKSPTENVWVINRIQANGSKDYAAVNALQRAITTTPLSSFGKKYSWPAGAVDPTIDMKTAVGEQVNAMSGTRFFETMAAAMKDNPPASADAPMVAQMARIGLTPGSFTPDSAMVNAIDAGAKAGLAKIEASIKTVGRVQNHWRSVVDCGVYGTNYMVRSVAAIAGLGCNLPQDAIYAMAMEDADGRPFDGANKYVVHFPAGQLPPVRAFWSITMYDAHNFLVANPIDRSAASSWMKFDKNPDGSIDIYVQHASPGAAKEANWLPAPSGPFVLMLRMYWPKDAVITGAWMPPGVKRLD